jgi:putative oxidoreductase
MGGRASAERWALAILRGSLGVFLLLWGIGKLVVAAGAATISPPLSGGVATLEIVLGAFILLGLWRRWSYAALFSVHVGSLLLWWRTLQDPWGVALAGLPVCGALVALYLLRDRDGWALDTWLALRRPWRLAP